MDTLRILPNCGRILGQIRIGVKNFMAYEMIVLDLDGTLTNSKKEISAKTKEALIKVQEHGQKVVLASGRPTFGITRLAKELLLDQYEGYILSFNGARIIDFQTGKVIYNKSLPMEYIPLVYKEAAALGVGINTYAEDAVILGNGVDEYNTLECKINGVSPIITEDFPGYVNFPVNKCLLTGKPEKIKEAEEIFKNKFGKDLNIYKSEPYFLEIMPQNIDKAYSLGKLLEHAGLSRKQMICCGDGYNDLSMIHYAGLGVAMANAQSIVKESADFITGSNDEDGIVTVVEKFMLPF